MPADGGPDLALIHTVEIPHFASDGILEPMADGPDDDAAAPRRCEHVARGTELMLSTGIWFSPRLPVRVAFVDQVSATLAHAKGVFYVQLERLEAAIRQGIVRRAEEPASLQERAEVTTARSPS